MIADCVILAGGFGTRLQSVVADKPKCLAEIQGVPFLYYLCKYLQQFQPERVIFSVGYKMEMVIDYIDLIRHEFTMDFLFAKEHEPLGTGGAIVNAIPFVQTDDFFVMNGDTLFDVNLTEMLTWQKDKMADCTLALKTMMNADRYGLVNLDAQHEIIAFEEKQVGKSGLINGGVYCIYKKGFVSIPFPTKFSFEKDYLEKFLHERSMTGFIQDAYFIDIGIPEDYTKAQTEIPQLFTC
ncbi:MAG TPA: nucleotidyltransferase family protein [Chitinophagaceae bacterium]|nr:nucleotidyltransferase family protein [Chitinophagaceae bacterium]